MPSAATAAVSYSDMNFVSAPTATSVSKNCTADGRPMRRILPMCRRAARRSPGRSATTPTRRRAAMIPSRMSIPTAFEMAVASPAPSAPMPRKRGSTNSGSSSMLMIPPAETPTDAAKALPSARMRLARTVLRMENVPPTEMTQRE